MASTASFANANPLSPLFWGTHEVLLTHNSFFFTVFAHNFAGGRGGGYGDRGGGGYDRGEMSKMILFELHDFSDMCFALY